MNPRDARPGINGTRGHAPLWCGHGLTPAGHALRAQVEDQTDRLAAPPWQHLGERQTEDVVRIGKAMTRAVATAGAFPREGVFAAR